MRHVAVKWIDGIVVVRPRHIPNGLCGNEETDQLEKVLQTLNDENAQHVVLNLTEVKFMVSRALSVLVVAHKHFAERGAEIRLSNLCDHINQIFVVTRLCMIFDVYETEREAIESFLAERRETKLRADEPASAHPFVAVAAGEDKVPDAGLSSSHDRPGTTAPTSRDR